MQAVVARSSRVSAVVIRAREGDMAASRGAVRGESAGWCGSGQGVGCGPGRRTPPVSHALLTESRCQLNLTEVVLSCMWWWELNLDSDRRAGRVKWAPS
ncbi:hypothetical protein GCM10014713_67040 [Streptomyces purpureus]|uniref:Uncharacterized protein n=1 Tax=Streptomyces purpureus TaxID=1951 RepID=A0A918HJX2_9ACTN|nr:hypothetical protein GCM10014713_67040 [Streptomyces purpureus]